VGSFYWGGGELLKSLEKLSQATTANYKGYKATAIACYLSCEATLNV